MTFLSWLIRILIVAFILRLILRLFAAGRPQARGRRPARPAERLGGTLVQDPECGTYIPKTRAIAAGHGAAAKYFCSTTCRDRYLSANRRAS